MSAARRLAVGLVVVAALAAAANALAAPSGPRAPTAVSIEGFTSTGIKGVILGHIESPNSKCLDNRQVTVTVIPKKGSPFVFDVARTSKRGGWTAAMYLDELEAGGQIKKIKAEVGTRKVKLANGKKLSCGSAGVALKLM